MHIVGKGGHRAQAGFRNGFLGQELQDEVDIIDEVDTKDYVTLQRDFKKCIP